MHHLLVRQRFECYQQWREAFDSLEQARSAAGLVTELVSLNAADAREVIVLFTVTDPVRAREYQAGAALAEAWRRGGVDPDSNEATALLDPSREGGR